MMRSKTRVFVFAACVATLGLVSWSRRPTTPAPAAPTELPAAPLLAAATRPTTPEPRSTGRSPQRPSAPTLERLSLTAAAPSYAFHQTKLDPADARLVHEAQEREVQRCMHARGLPYATVPFEDDHSAYDAPQSHDVEGARAIGYGIALAAERGGDTPDLGPNTARYASMSSDERRAFDSALLGDLPDLSGQPDSDGFGPDIAVVHGADDATLFWDRRSCVAVAERSVFGDDLAAGELRLQLAAAEDAIWRAVDESQAMRAGLERWRACMRKSGYAYETPDSAASELADAFERRALDLEQLRAQELAVASADAGCQASTDLPTLREATHRQLAEQLAPAHQVLLARVVESNHAAVARSTRVLAETERAEVQTESTL